MNKTLMSFNDRAMSSGLITVQPDLARELKSATQKFMHLTQAAQAISGSDIDDEEPKEADQPAKKRTKASEKRQNPSQARNSSPTPQPVPTVERADIGWGYSAAIEPQSTTPTGIESMAASLLPGYPLSEAVQTIGRMQQPSSTNYLPFFPFRHDDDTPRVASNANQFQFQQYQALMPSPPLLSMDPADQVLLGNPLKESRLQPPWTYSFQETNFSRRLHRATLERGYHVLSNVEHKPVLFERIFRLTLLYSTREQLLARFKSLLSKGINDPLEYFQVPFIHLGGAGTHYPQLDENGNPKAKPNAFNVRSIGPLPDSPNRVRLEMVSAGAFSARPGNEVELDLEGFEGQWFDPYDVEGYLQEKGVVISPYASFAEAELPSTDLALSSMLEVPPINAMAASASPSGSTRGLTPGTCSTLSAPDTPLPIPSTGLGAAPSNDDGTGIPVDEASLFGFGDFGSSGVYSTGPDF